MERLPVNFDKHGARLPTCSKCPREIDVAEGGGEEQIVRSAVELMR
jgi:hypothetical protein